MPKERWTFESLCQADKPTLEKVIRGSKPPNQEALNGYVYDGYNHDWLGQIPGKKFRKALTVYVLFLNLCLRWHGLPCQVVKQIILLKAGTITQAKRRKKHWVMDGRAL